VKGINWFGSEGRTGAPSGLNKNPIEWYIDLLAENGFNAIRLLFNHDSVLKNDLIETADVRFAPELYGLNYLEMFAELADCAARRGLLVMMACHRLNPKAWPGDGKWFDGTITEARVLQSWDKVAHMLCSRWNVFAVDLQNEPHASSWAKNSATDWNKAAERIGNHVLTKCKRWLIMVEGVGYNPGAPGLDDPSLGVWWGENLAGAKVAPVRLSDQTKLVYTPHTYGPGVYMQSYFRAPNFPHNMEAIWDQHFAFVQQSTGQPIVIGEMGGTYVGKDRTWQDWAFGLIKQRGIGLFYFCLNPDSEDSA